MLGDFKVPRMLIVNMIAFVKVSNFFMLKNIYIMMSRVAHWNTLEHNLPILVCKGKMCVEHTNGKCHVFTFQDVRGR